MPGAVYQGTTILARLLPTGLLSNFPPSGGEPLLFRFYRNGRDFDLGTVGQSRNLHGSPHRPGFRKEIRVDLIHRSEIAHIRQIDVYRYYVTHMEPSIPNNLLDVFQSGSRLSEDASSHYFALLIGALEPRNIKRVSDYDTRA